MKVVRFAGLVLVFALAASAGAARVDVYANSFREGGWKLDVQFMDVMGSPYLLAHGLGFAVPDAVATATVPEGGLWRVWVRTRKWVEGAGAFKVLVGAHELAPVFGRGSSDWSWEDGGEVELTAGETEIRLRDLDGFDGRCAGVVLTKADGKGSGSPQGPLAVTDRAPELTRAFDLVVVGGGLPGCCAAVSAARRGLKVALVQDRPVPGGNASGEVRVWSAGEIRYPLIRELRGKFMNMRYENAFSDADRQAFLEREPNLGLFLSHRAFGVEMKDGRIAAVKALDVARNRVVAFAAPYFCDATGDGWVGFWAGADYRYGREGRDETGERYAPEKGDRMTLGSSIMWESSVGTYDIPFSAPWAEPYACGISKINGDWNWEFGLRQDIIATGEEVRDRVLLAIYGAFSNAKRDPANAHRKLVTCPFVLGKRETRRLMGDHVFCEQDVIGKRLFDDAVATGSWSIDLHYTIDEKIPFLTRCEQPHYGRYWIPYRSLYSRNVPNLFMAGRCFSCTHVGLGSPRVMNTLAQLGCAVGEAAALCKEGGYLPRELYTGGHARALQRRLGGDFPGNPDPVRRGWAYVDDEDADVAFTGKWSLNWNHSGGQRGDRTHYSSDPAAAVEYPLPVKAAGRYRLMGLVPHLFLWEKEPVVDLVVRSGGQETRLEWNQYPESGFWRDLGAFDLQPGATLRLSRSARCTDRRIVADGFALVPADGIGTLPADADPRAVGLRLARHFASCAPDEFAPRGYSGASMSGAFISYPISVLWASSIELARRAGDRELESLLASRFTAPFLPGGVKNAKCPDPCHVDLSVFGTVMLESFLSTGDRKALAFGESYVERQWAEPKADDYARLPPSMRGGGHTRELGERHANWAAGLTGQTRFWTDDLFMIGYLQTRGALAAAADGRPEVAAARLDRAARQVVRYLDDLQLREGRAAGLFHHAPDAPQVWGRGNGWAAAGITEVLDCLPEDSPHRPRILEGYRRMMAALLRHRRANGMWGQLVDVARSWDESSATAIFTYAFIRGVRRGWLDAATYGPAARASYLALVARLDADANLGEVCVGTDIGKTEAHYLGRARVTGAPHGQAGLLLCVNALLAP